MYLDEIIESECVENRFDAWTDYRTSLTEYIIKSVEDYYIREKLTGLKLRRLNYEYSIEDASLEFGRPLLAIWGAGGCNDIDIQRLSKYFNLVFIDNNEKVVKSGIKRFNLDESQYVYTDLRFWDVSYDDYEMFEALLMEGASSKEIIGFLNELTDKMSDMAYVNSLCFDFSVIVGLASQLVSRFVALLHYYKDKYSKKELEAIYIQLEAMSDLAVNRMYKFITKTTKNMFIVGYEQCVFDCEKSADMLDGPSDIQGNNVLAFLLEHGEKELGEIRLFSDTSLSWPFAEDKSYLMRNMAYIFC